MFAVAGIREIREAAGRYAGGFDPALVTATDAQRIVEEATAVEHMMATVKALAAERVARTDLWRRQGDRSAAHHLARTTGTSRPSSPPRRRRRRPPSVGSAPMKGGPRWVRRRA